MPATPAGRPESSQGPQTVTRNKAKTIYLPQKQLQDQSTPIRRGLQGGSSAGELIGVGQWFGYYDKLEFDPTEPLRPRHGGRSSSTARRGPTTSSRSAWSISTDKDRWIELRREPRLELAAGLHAAMAAGLEDRSPLERSRGATASSVTSWMCVSRKKRTLPRSCLRGQPRRAHGRSTCDFRRLNDTRPGYGYAGIADPDRESAACPRGQRHLAKWIWPPASQTLLVVRSPMPTKFPNADARLEGRQALVQPPAVVAGRQAVHLPAPLARRQPRAQVVLHAHVHRGSRWQGPATSLDPFGKTSHFIWRDAQHILAWALHPSHGERFYLYKDKSDRVDVVGQDVHDRERPLHVSARQSVDSERHLSGQAARQHPYLYHVSTGKRVPLGHFRLPPEYAGEWRCDTHPRFSRDGTKVVIDSPHGGNGRQLYLIDIRDIVG